ncbi:MAG: membrane protein insertion efficiency factor YidD [Candidatus Omnitrophica bacterium]|nr:membrane protein insertion efficiency factor YidD [Candidatus Omnitrophota bacterium]
MLRRIIISPLDIYQKHIRAMLPCACRFSPSCSEYTKQAIIKYGALKGVYKGIIRLLHCHPFSRKSGYDPLV